MLHHAHPMQVTLERCQLPLTPLLPTLKYPEQLSHVPKHNFNSAQSHTSCVLEKGHGHPVLGAGVGSQEAAATFFFITS